MSVPGQSRQFGQVPATSGLPRTTDIIRPAQYVSMVPMADLANVDSFQPRRPYRSPMILPVAGLMKCRDEHAGHSTAS
jgi:hypothetical protein